MHIALQQALHVTHQTLIHIIGVEYNFLICTNGTDIRDI